MKYIRMALCLLCVLCMALSMQSAGAATPEVPRVSFYVEEYVGYLGWEATVFAVCHNPASITADNNTFELRNHRGEVLATVQWLTPTARLTIRFEVPASALGGNELSLWWNGVKVTQKHAYAAFSVWEDRGVTCLAPREPAIALTIVCGGGGEKHVGEILAVLDKHGVKATFFLGGGWLQSNVTNARRIVAAGHEIGSHGNRHVYMTQLGSIRQQRVEITAMNRRCEEQLGVRPRLFRAPFSDTNQQVTALVRAEGMEEIMWNIDSMDWLDEYRDRPGTILNIVTHERVVSGSVIQFHLDGHNTAQVLDEAIPYYRNVCGYRVVTVGELLELSGREIPPLPDVAAPQ